MKSPKIHRVLVYTDKEYSRVVDLWIHVADAAIGLRRASKNKEMWTKHIVCFTAVELEKNVTSYEIFRKIVVRTSTAHRWRSSKKKNLATVRERTNPTTWKHIFQLERQSRGP